MTARKRPIRRRLGVYAGVLFTGLLFNTAASLGRDRPGTPNNERAYSCGKPRAEVCVQFDNTASEPVRFDTELTINGTGVGANGLPEIDCLTPNTPPTKRRICIGGANVCGAQGARAIFFGCEAGRRLALLKGRQLPSGGSVSSAQRADQTVANGKTGHTYRADARGGGKENALSVHPSQGFKLVGLNHDATYCLRFRARRASDDVVSERWSNWACAKTRAEEAERPAPKPGPPAGLKANYLPGGQDWRKNPPRVVITWRAAGNATSYAVDKLVPSAGFKSVDAAPGNPPRKGDARSGFEHIDILSEDEVKLASAPGITYRVCATNKTGATCSQSSTYDLLGGVATQRDGNRGKVMTQQPDGRVVQTPGKPSDAMKAPPTLPRGPGGGVLRPRPLPRL